MGKAGRTNARSSEADLVRQVERAFRTVGLPWSDDPAYLLQSLIGALPSEVLEEFDGLENNEQARVALVFASSANALWLGAGLRAPMLRAQLPWILNTLRTGGIRAESTVLDVGAGCGLTASIIQRATSCSMVAIDPQPGSAAAITSTAGLLGATVAAHEVPPVDICAVIPDQLDAVVAQAVFTYAQQGVGARRAPNAAAVIRRTVANPPVPSGDAAAIFEVGARAACLLVADHDHPVLWGFVLAHAASSGLVPDWANARVDQKDLLLGPDRQLCVSFHRGAAGSDDVERLIGLLEPSG